MAPAQPMIYQQHMHTDIVDSYEDAIETIHSISTGVICLSSPKPPTSSEWARANFMVIRGDSEQPGNLSTYTDIPEHIPLLVLGSSQKPPVLIHEKIDSRPVDYLALPISRAMLHHKIIFLNKVSKICTEHHINSLTLNRQLDAITSRDTLTGLFNRRHFTIHLIDKLQQGKRSNKDVSLLMLNIDYFNKVNKSSGIEFGDFILNEIAARLTVATKKYGTCYRFTGEVFIVLLPDTSLNFALKIAEKIRGHCTGKPFRNRDKQTSITLSIGVASLQSHSPADYNEFITMAETALFMAKAEGRNRVIPYGTEEEYSTQESLAFLKETLNKILAKTRRSTIASLQLLAKNVVGPKNQQHITTVSRYIHLLGEKLSLPEQHIQTFQNAIILYNSIRFLLHNDLLSKPGIFTGSERKTMDDLPFKLTELTEMFDYFSNERAILLHHGERFDGTGKPQGLKGDEIPLGARIFTIVDALAAMNSDRPHRKKLSPAVIIKELSQGAGRQFDPALVLQILKIITENRLVDIDEKLVEQAHQDIIKKFPQLMP